MKFFHGSQLLGGIRVGLYNMQGEVFECIEYQEEELKKRKGKVIYNLKTTIYYCLLVGFMYITNYYDFKGFIIIIIMSSMSSVTAITDQQLRNA